MDPDVIDTLYFNIINKENDIVSLEARLSDTLLSGNPEIVTLPSSAFRKTMSLGVVTPSTGLGKTT